MSKVPRTFDPENVHRTRLIDTPHALSERYPHLTEPQHQERILIAMHEAAHFVVAVALNGTVGYHAFIRVPGKSPTEGFFSRRRASGSVACWADGLNAAMVRIAAPLASFMVGDPAWEATGRDDFEVTDETIKEWLVRNDKPVEAADSLSLKVIDAAAFLLVRLWPLVDWVATALLLYGDSKGELGRQRWIGIRRFVHNYFKLSTQLDRIASFPVPGCIYRRVEKLQKQKQLSGALYPILGKCQSCRCHHQ